MEVKIDYSNRELPPVPPPSFMEPPPAYFIEQPQVQVVTAATPMMVFVSPSTVISKHPQQMTCPHCQLEIVTEVTYSSGRVTHIWGAVLCLLGCVPCCLIPYCVDELKDVSHECPNCNRHLGTYRR